MHLLRNVCLFVLCIVLGIGHLWASGSLLARIDFVDISGKNLPPEKGWVVLSKAGENNLPSKSSALKPAITPVHWEYMSGKMQPFVQIVPWPVKLTVHTHDFRVPDFTFSDGRSVLQLKGRAKSKSRYFVKPGYYQVEVSSFPGIVGRILVQAYSYAGQPDLRGIFVLEDIPIGLYNVSLIHVDLPSVWESSLRIEATGVTKAVLCFSEAEQQ